MRREHHRLNCRALGWPMEMLTFGHWGPPLIALPTSKARFYEWENFGMVEALRKPLEEGRIKLYCPDGVDWDNWFGDGAHPGHRAWRYTKYLDYIVHDVVSFVREHCGGADVRPWLAGASWGAYHAVNLALKYPELFGPTILMSGAYDTAPFTGGYVDENVYATSPVLYAWGIEPGEYRDRLARAANLLLVCGQGKWQERSLRETWELHRALEAKGIAHGFDIWGTDSEHDWPAWRYQIRQYVDRFSR